MGLYEFAPHTDLIAFLGKTACMSKSPFQFICSNIVFLMFGYDVSQLNPVDISIRNLKNISLLISFVVTQIMLPAIIGSVPAGTSSKDIVHFGQLVHSRDFRKFDYGTIKNKDLYGSFEPPAYNLSNVKAPVALHYGLNDALDSPLDVERLYRRLPNVIAYREVPYPQFNHIDFVWATNARELVYNDVLKIMKSFEPSSF